MPSNMTGGKKKRSAKKKSGQKRKPSAYNVFVKKYMNLHKGEKDVTKLMKNAAAEWRKLTDAEKKKYA